VWILPLLKGAAFVYLVVKFKIFLQLSKWLACYLLFIFFLEMRRYGNLKVGSFVVFYQPETAVMVLVFNKKKLKLKKSLVRKAKTGFHSYQTKYHTKNNIFSPTSCQILQV